MKLIAPFPGHGGRANGWMRRITVLLTATFGMLTMGTGTALACGGLVAANGSVQLLRTSTLAAYVDGNEHYVTNFEFASPEESFGSIVPLPGEPTEVERAGDWTLQRLTQEVAPPIEFAEDAAVPTAAAGEVDVLQQVQVDALDITIVRGDGDDVAAWAEDQGFELSDDAPEFLEGYADRSPYFMAARFDAERAAEDEFQSGDGIPVHLEIPVDNPWVPLHILALGKPDTEVVQADVFLLTEDEPALLSGPGLTLERSEEADDLLLDDIRSDQNSEWVPEDAWLSYLSVDAPAGDLQADLAIDVHGDEPSMVDAGLVDDDFRLSPPLHTDGAGENAAGPRGEIVDATDDAGWSWRMPAVYALLGLMATCLVTATALWVRSRHAVSF